MSRMSPRASISYAGYGRAAANRARKSLKSLFPGILMLSRQRRLLCAAWQK